MARKIFPLVPPSEMLFCLLETKLVGLELVSPFAKLNGEAAAAAAVSMVSILYGEYLVEPQS